MPTAIHLYIKVNILMRKSEIQMHISISAPILIKSNQIKSSLSLVSLSKETVSGAPTTELVRTSDSPKSDVIKSSVRGKVKNGAGPFIQEASENKR